MSTPLSHISGVLYSLAIDLNNRGSLSMAWINTSLSNEDIFRPYLAKNYNSLLIIFEPQPTLAKRTEIN